MFLKATIAVSDSRGIAMTEVKKAVDFWLSFKVDVKKTVEEWCRK